MLGLGERLFSSAVVFVPTTTERQRCLKKRAALEQMDPQNTDIYAAGLLEHYKALKPEHSSLSLARFAAGYRLRHAVEKISEDLPDNPLNDLAIHIVETTIGKVFHKRRQDAIIRYYNCNKKRDPEQWAKTMLTLYAPLSRQDDLLAGQASWVSAWGQQLQDPITRADYDTFENAALQHTDLFELEEQVWQDLERKGMGETCEQVPKNYALTLRMNCHTLKHMNPIHRPRRRRRLHSITSISAKFQNTGMQIGGMQQCAA